MNKIDEIALRVSVQHGIRRNGEQCFDDSELIDFAHALLAELRKDAEPTCIVSNIGVIQNITNCPLEPGLRLFTHPAPVIASEQKPVAEVFDYLEEELSAISCRYHGDPSYDHDAY
jgi:hypothetical protein